jgi:hypothetical protein
LGPRGGPMYSSGGSDMSHLPKSALVMAATVSVMVAGVSIHGQSPAAGTKAKSAKSEVAAKTPWGQPDLQGIWDFRTVTPMERPAELAGKETLTEAEALAYEKKIVASRNADTQRDQSTRRVVNGTAETQDVANAYNEFWWDRGTKVIGTRRTSLIIEPKDGHFPPLTEEGKKRLAAEDAVRERPAEGPEDRSVGERCILGFNSGPPMSPGGYNQNVQIFQTPDYVVLVNEMVHNARFIPLDGRPVPNIKQWTGQSRGRWEGDTLVVETKNFYQNTSLRGSSPNMHLIERFKKIEGGLLYTYTVDDPTTWTSPWTVEMPMVKTDAPMYEYACHEGNYGMTGLLAGARAVDAKASEKKPSTK